MRSRSGDASFPPLFLIPCLGEPLPPLSVRQFLPYPGDVSRLGLLVGDMGWDYALVGENVGAEEDESVRGLGLITERVRRG